ncbi:uncharacterized protein O3C94_011260 [Discoglossus pictus]
MSRDKKKMTERILNHALQIIYLLTGEVSLLQHLTNSPRMKEVNKDQKVTEKILNHALQIIYLLTGEEYTIVKKNSPHSSNYQMTGEGDIDGQKEIMNENHQTRITLGIPGNRSPGLQYENIDTISEEEDGIDEKDILQVTIQSGLFTGLQDDNLYPVSVNAEGHDGGVENDIQQMAIPSDPCAGLSNVKPSISPKLEQVEPKVMGHQQVKEEELPINISKELPDVNQSIPLKLEPEEETNVMGRQQVKEEEIPLSINEDGHLRSDFRKTFSTIACTSEGQLGDDTSLCKDVQSKDLNRNSPEHTLYQRGNRNVTLVSYQCDQNPCAVNERIIADLNDETCRSVKKKKDSRCEKTTTLQNKEAGQKPMAGKGSAQRMSLNTNNRTHTRGKPYVCPDCGKGFSHKVSLNVHHRTHTGEKPYVCPHCGKGFTQRANLDAHRRTHTGEKPYVCSQCGKGFSQSTSLNTHYRTHTGEKPYVCPVCGKGFSQRASLNAHHITHNREKQYDCPECGESFSEKKSLSVHQKTHIV